jgi:phage/plasmid-like protein (TIGR03299 family)
MPSEIESLFYHRNPCWHGLGIRLENPPTSKEALIAAGLDWKVVQVPIFTKNEGEDNQINNYKANVRETDGSVLGIVTDRYKIVQNEEAFEFVDYLLGEGVTFETAGSLFEGKKVWMLAILPGKYKIINDTIAPYLAFVNTHDGNESIKVMLTPTRIVCNNTLNIALKTAQRSWSCVHAGNIEYKLEEAKKTLRLAETYIEKLTMEAEILHNIPMFKHDVETFIEELLPVPKNAGKVKEGNVLRIREEIFDRYYRAPDLRRMEGSNWKMLNAISDYAVHSAPLRKTESYNSNNFDRILNGHPLIDRAYDLLKKVA